MADIGLVLTGGGARGAYQVGVLSWLAKRYPELDIPIITGVSAGAVNAAKLASRFGTFSQSVEELRGLWSELRVEDVFRASAWSLAWSAARWGTRLMAGGKQGVAPVRGFLDTQPLRDLLTEVLVSRGGGLAGIEYNLQRGALKAAAVVTASYTTGQSVVWVEGQGIEAWERPARRAVQTRLRVDHIMASAALPIFFPAVQVDDPAIGPHWYGDGGMRLSAPLSPALHLGAQKVLAISTRHDRSQQESDEPKVFGYPPPAQVLGMLLNSVFLDLIDQDVLRLERLNTLLDQLPPEKRKGLRPIRVLTIRPSRDLANLAADYELKLPWAFRFMTRGLGTQETRSPDILAMLMFNPEFLQAVMAMGERDAEARAHDLVSFVEDGIDGERAVSARS